MNCAFSSKYFCTEHFVFLTMLSKITSKYILGIPYGSKVDKNGSVMLQKAIFYNVSTKKMHVIFWTKYCKLCWAM